MQCYSLPEWLEVRLHRGARLRRGASAAGGKHGQPWVDSAAPGWRCFATEEADQVLPTDGSPALLNPRQNILQANQSIHYQKSAWMPYHDLLNWTRFIITIPYTKWQFCGQRNGKKEITLLRRWWPSWMPRSKLLWWDSTLSGKIKARKSLKCDKRQQIVHLYIFR